MFDALPDQPQEFELTTRLEKGDYLYPAPDDMMADPDNKGVWNVGGKQFKGAGLAVEWIEVEGPREPQWPLASVQQVFGDIEIGPRQRQQWKNGENVLLEPKSKNPSADAERLILDFAMRAFRRPLKAGDAKPFVQLAKRSMESGASFEDAVRLGIRTILCSPKFLILDEKPERLDSYALASRLSYFLTSMMPDSELLTLAANDSLLQDDVLDQQVSRLLHDARSEDFLESFVGQWLDLRKINATNPDMRLYPEFEDSLKHSMLSETQAFVRKILENDLPVTDFIDSDFTMLNRRLAEHYGISGVEGHLIQKVSLANDSPRGGWRTRYRSQDKGDPPEHKLLGRYIWEYKLGQTIDPSSELATGEKFAEIREFKKLIGQQQGQVAKAVIEKLLVYATGSPIELADRKTVEEIQTRMSAGGSESRSIIHQIVQSDLFRTK